MNIELRNPNTIMKLSRLGSFHQSKLSFLRSFLSEFKSITFPYSPLRDPNIWSRLTLMIPPLLTFLVFFICLWWLPNVKLRFIDIFPAAFLAAIAEEINKMVFILYLRNFSGFSGSIYGLL